RRRQLRCHRAGGAGARTGRRRSARELRRRQRIALQTRLRADPAAVVLTASVDPPGVVRGDFAEAVRDGEVEAGRVVGVEDEVVDHEGAGRGDEVAAPGDVLLVLAGAYDLRRLDVEAEGEAGD